MHKHLRRLDRVWIETPIYFVTSCTRNRRAYLACETAAAVLQDEWQNAQRRHGWLIGRYVVMPEHVHFFCAPEYDAKPLSKFMGFWKEWTSKRIEKALRLTDRLWQEEFFDQSFAPMRVIAKNGNMPALIPYG